MNILEYNECQFLFIFLKEKTNCFSAQKKGRGEKEEMIFKLVSLFLIRTIIVYWKMQSN